MVRKSENWLKSHYSPLKSKLQRWIIWIPSNDFSLLRAWNTRGKKNLRFSGSSTSFSILKKWFVWNKKKWKWLKLNCSRIGRKVVELHYWSCIWVVLKLYLSPIKVVFKRYWSYMKLYVHVVNMVNQLLTLLSSKKRYSRESCQKICLSKFTREFRY